MSLLEQRRQDWLNATNPLLRAVAFAKYIALAHILERTK